MNTQINNELIRSFNPCYDPKDVCEENETLSIKEWIEKYVDKVKSKQDIIWLLCCNDFMSDRDLRLFAVWCARSTYQFCETIDQRSIDAVDCAERFANGNATIEELSAARSAAWSTAWSAARSAAESAAESAARSAAESAAESAAWCAAESAARSAARSAAWSTAWSAAWCTVMSAQINQLLTYFK